MISQLRATIGPALRTPALTSGRFLYSIKFPSRRGRNGRSSRVAGMAAMVGSPVPLRAYGSARPEMSTDCKKECAHPKWSIVESEVSYADRHQGGIDVDRQT